MKIGLIDIDSKIPNLALMKISAWHKKQGDEVELTQPLFADQFNLIYASQVFDFSTLPLLPEKTIYGGSGFNLDFKLEDRVEEMMPDYSLYPNSDYAIGFTSRGCNRDCPFCIVPRKEGLFRTECDIYRFWNGQKKIMLLDNSLNTDDFWFGEILDSLIKERLLVDFNQGLDIRYLNNGQAEQLTRVKLWKQIHFAWDSTRDEARVRDGIRILKRYRLTNKSMFYVLVGFDSTQEEDLYRVMTLRDLGLDPFVMPFDKFDPYQKDFARWVNHKAIFKTVSWKNYEKNKD